jgi:small conductance mechanosensitive channel
MHYWTDLVLEKLRGWGTQLIKMLPNIGVAVLVIVAFFLLGRLFQKLIFRLTIKISGKPSVSALFSTIANVIILLTGVFIALDVLQLDKAVSSLLAGAGIITLVLGFAFQDLSANFISGIFMAFKKPFDVGDTIETNSYTGNIEEIQLRTTTIRTFQGLHLMIPNRDIFQKPILNYSRSNERKIELEFLVSYINDLKALEQIVQGELKKFEYLHEEKKPEIYFTSIQDNNIKMLVGFWIYNHKPPGFMAARHEAIKRITDAFKSSQIAMATGSPALPFEPQQKNHTPKGEFSTAGTKS